MDEIGNRASATRPSVIGVRRSFDMPGKSCGYALTMSARLRVRRSSMVIRSLRSRAGRSVAKRRTTLKLRSPKTSSRRKKLHAGASHPVPSFAGRAQRYSFVVVTASAGAATSV